MIDDAWGRLPDASPSDTPGRFTRARFERIAQMLAAVAAAVLGLQSFAVALGEGQASAHPALLAAVFVPLLLFAASCLAGVAVRAVAGAFAVLFPIVLVGWAIVDRAPVDPHGQPWPFYLLTIATAAAMLAFPLWCQIAWAVGLPALFAAIRLVGGGWSLAVWESTLFDVSAALLLGALVVVLGWMYRRIAGGVDEARARVVQTYTDASVAEAAESERVEIAALMHDSVLAALLAAERAASPRERELAVAMAREALGRLANAESDDPEGSDDEVSAPALAEALEERAGELGIALHVDRLIDADARDIPGRPARALVLAATQAIANAVQHADAVGLAVGLRADAQGVAISVGDAGPGLDFDAIEADRLGIRGSILARMSAAGGSADIHTGANGTVVTVAWHVDGPETADTGEGR